MLVEKPCAEPGHVWGVNPGIGRSGVLELEGRDADGSLIIPLVPLTSAPGNTKS